MIAQDTLFGPEDPGQFVVRREQLLADAVADLVAMYGFDPVEVALGRIKIQMAGPVASAPARDTDPRTSKSSSKRNIDVRRFSTRSQCGRLLNFFVEAETATDKQATDAVMGLHAPIKFWEGCRRRCSDLRRAGYISDTGAEFDGRIVWRPTPEGRAAHHRMLLTGWTR